MVKRKDKYLKLVNEKLKLFISYFDISIQSLQYIFHNTHIHFEGVHAVKRPMPEFIIDQPLQTCN